MMYGRLGLLCFFANVLGTSAFSAPTPISPQLEQLSQPPAATGSLPFTDPADLFPIYPRLELIQGGGTVKTYPMPPWADRCQMFLKTEGRPLRAKVELWLGPLRVTHRLNLNVEDGNLTPFQTTLKFKKASPTLKVSTSESFELPIYAGVYVPTPERADVLLDNTELLWNSCDHKQKQFVQGGRVQGGGGAVRYWDVAADVESVQVIGWSKDASKKSFRVEIEVLQGPNNPKQRYFLQCGGGSQPYHCVIQTPGPGSVIRMINKKFMEDGLTQFAVLPFTYKKYGNDFDGEPPREIFY